MRLNKLLAQHGGLSRRSADNAILDGRVLVNGKLANIGQTVKENDVVTLDGQALETISSHTTIMLNKPIGYVCSRDGQGSKTIYDLLPDDLQHLKTIGRLDKDSSGLILLTSDGELAHRLTHPSFEKEKHYRVTISKPLVQADKSQITGPGVRLNDGPSRLGLEPLDANHVTWIITMHEGRNRQIRRTFAALGYEVNALHRTQFGGYQLGQLQTGSYQEVEN